MNETVKIYYRRHEPETAGSREAGYQHQTGLELLKHGLKEAFGLDYSADMIVRTEYGKPLWKDGGCHFNISHCPGLVVCAVGPVPLGVDVETEDRRITQRLIGRSLEETERAYAEEDDTPLRFLRLWTLKESYLKMTGEGLRVPLRDVVFRIRSEQRLDQTGWIGGEDIRCSREGCFYQTILEDRFILSLSMSGKLGPPVCMPV